MVKEKGKQPLGVNGTPECYGEPDLTPECEGCMLFPSCLRYGMTSYRPKERDGRDKDKGIKVNQRG